MVCGCCTRGSPEARKVAEACPYKGRRLRHAAQEVERRRVALLDRSRTMTIESCDGSTIVHEQVCTSLRIAAVDLEQRFRYLSRAPWCFCLADTPAGAQIFLKQARAGNINDHDPLTQRLLNEFQPELERTAAGETCPPKLAEEVRIVNLTPLDESAGEGYHRSTHHARARAPASTARFVKQQLRLRENISRCRRFIKKHGEVGREIFRFEWSQWPRILQTNPARQFRRVRMKPEAVFDRVYREDAMALEDWNSALSRQPTPRRLPDVTNSYALQVEYIQCVLKPLGWYSVVVKRDDADTDGNIVQVRSTEFFQVLKMYSGRSRPHLMPTAEADPEFASSLSLNIQRYTQYKADDVSAVVVYAEEDPQWTAPSDVAPFVAFRDTLMTYATADSSQRYPTCIELGTAGRVQPQLSLTDDDCPTWCILDALRRRGFRF